MSGSQKRVRASKVAPPPAAGRLRVIQLDPLDALELRQLEASRQCALAVLQLAEQQLRTRATLVTQAHGVDLSSAAVGRWNLDVERGLIEEQEG